MWSPSSRLISSLLNVRPGIIDRFVSQKMLQNDPEKKMPSTAANARSRYGKLSVLFIYFSAQAAFFPTAGTVSVARNKKSFSSLSEI